MTEVKLNNKLYSKCKNADEKAQIRASYLAAYEYRQAMIHALKSKADATRKDSIKADAYDNANWAYKQADMVGYLRAIEEILNFL